MKVNNKIFLSMEPFASYLKFWINLDEGKLNDPEEKTRDVSKLGHHGVGNYEINIKRTLITKLVFSSMFLFVAI